MAIESKDIGNFTFIWLTDGNGWYSAKHNLEETFEELKTTFNLYDLEKGVLNNVDNLTVDEEENK